MSLGNNALYISFLRGFSVAMRNVFIGAPEDEVFGVVREDTGRFSFGSLRAPSGSVCSSFAAGRNSSFELFNDAEGAGRGGFTNVRGSDLCGFVFGASRGFSDGIESLVNIGGSALGGLVSCSFSFSSATEGFINFGGPRSCDFLDLGTSRGCSGIEGFTNCVGSDLCGFVIVDTSGVFSYGIEGFMIAEDVGLGDFVTLGASRRISG